MADDKKKGGLLSRFKGSKQKDTLLAEAGARKPPAVSSNPVPKANPAPKAEPVTSAKPAPAAQTPEPVPSQKQAIAEKSAPIEPGTEGDATDPIASFQFYIQSILSIGVSHVKLADMVSNAVAENLAKLTGGGKTEGD